MDKEQYLAMMRERARITDLAIRGVPLKARSRHSVKGPWEPCGEMPTLDFMDYEYAEDRKVFLVFDSKTATRAIAFFNEDEAQAALSQRKAAGTAQASAYIHSMDFDR